MRTKVTDYIEKAIEDSKKDGEEEGNPSSTSAPSGSGQVRLLIMPNAISQS